MELSAEIEFPFTKIRVLPYQNYSGAMNMALDFLFSEEMAGDSAPVFRFYGWDPPCLSLGYHQTEQSIDIKAIVQDGLEVVRRPTGGSAILHSDELTYSAVFPERKLSHQHMYKMVHHLFYESLRDLGYPVSLQQHEPDGNYLKMGSKAFACFTRPAFSEILYDNRKLLGSAQKIYPNSILQHGSLLIENKQADIVKYLKNDEPKKKSYRTALENSSVALNDLTTIKVNQNQIISKVLKKLEEKFKVEIYFKEPDNAELNRAASYLNKFSVN